MAKAVLSPAKVKMAERNAEMIELRKSGMSFHKISELYSISPKAVSEAIKRTLSQPIREFARETVELENLRLDTVLEFAWPAARDGDTRALLVVVKAMERRAKMLGLDAPTKHEMTQVMDFGDHLLSVAERSLDRNSYLKLVKALSVADKSGQSG